MIPLAVRQVRTCDFQISKKKGSEAQTVACGTDAVAVSFGLEADAFEIDLCDSHRTTFVIALMPFQDVARQTGKGTGKKKAKSPATTVDNAAVRKWLGTQGIEVSPKGRIPNKHIEAFQAATAA
jgi:hypothetical protein